MPAWTKVYALHNICPREWDVQNPLGFWNTDVSPNLGQTTGPKNNQQKSELSELWDFAVSADHSIKFKESEKKKKKDKYLEFARELKKLRNMKVMVITNVIGALHTVTKGLKKSKRTCGGRVEKIQTTVLLRSTRILRRVEETKRLAIQTPGRKHQQTPMWKILKE